jgi:arginyl-tRNA synthetase
MFLDDELLKMVKEADITTAEGIQKLNVDLCERCESYYKSKLTDNMPHPTQIKATLDRTFNLWDSFVKMALNDNDKAINILATLFTTHSFKNQFLQNKEMNEIYTKLGG